MKFNNGVYKNLGLEPLVPQVMAANTLELTSNTGYYFKYNVKCSAIVTGLQFYIGTYTSDTTYKFAFYNYLESGEITKYSYGSGSLLITSVGEKTVTFTTPMVLTKDVDVTIGMLRVTGGSSTMLVRASAPSYTTLGWTGTGSITDLPATDSTRSAINNYPYIEWITV